MSNKSRSDRGFTLVELIIVIVVIAILVAIGVVGFSSISTRAEESKLQSDLNGAIKKIAVDTVDTGVLPTNADNLPKSEGVTYQYTRTSDTGYCLTATSSKSGVKTYHVANGGGVAEGACSGHDYGAGSPSSPAAVATQKLNTFVANIKAHAQSSGLTMADYSTESSEPAKRDNVLAAHPGLGVGTYDYLVDSGGDSYYVYKFDIGDFAVTFVSVYRSPYTAQLYLRRSDGLALHPVAWTSEAPELDNLLQNNIIILPLYMPYASSLVGTTVDQTDAVTAAGSLSGLLGENIFTPISGGPGGPWVFGLDPGFPASVGSSEDVSSCRYHVSNVGQGYVKLDSASC